MKRRRLALPLALLTALLSACTPGGLADTTNPTVTLNAGPSTVTSAGTLTLSARATDNVGIKQVEFYLDNAATPFATDTGADANQTYTADLTWSAAQNGTHTVKAVAVDTSGNKGTDTSTVTVSIVTDTVNPTISISGVPETVTTAGTYVLAATATDNVGVTAVQVTLKRRDANGAETILLDRSSQEASFAYPLLLSSDLNGTYTLSVRASDAAGNTATGTRVVTVNIPAPPAQPDPTQPGPGPTPGSDTQPPSVSITVPGGVITTAGNYDIVITLADNVGVTSVSGYVQSESLGRIDLINLDPAGGKATIPVSKAFNGLNTIYITARDAAGNTTTKAASVTVAIP